MAPSHRENIKKTVLDEMMNCLAREYASLKTGDPRRAEIVEQMSELSLVAQQLEKPEVIH
jgi:hypothetical protein